jgi:polyferredoxin
LMLPYFMLGMALIHEHCKKLPNRKIFLVFLYVMLISLLWAVLIVAGYGFYYHVKLLNKYLSAGGTSSRS